MLSQHPRKMHPYAKDSYEVKHTIEAHWIQTTVISKLWITICRSELRSQIRLSLVNYITISAFRNFIFLVTVFFLIIHFTLASSVVFHHPEWYHPSLLSLEHYGSFFFRQHRSICCWSKFYVVLRSLILLFPSLFLRKRVWSKDRKLRYLLLRLANYSLQHKQQSNTHNLATKWVGVYLPKLHPGKNIGIIFAKVTWMVS